MEAGKAVRNTVEGTVLEAGNAVEKLVERQRTAVAHTLLTRSGSGNKSEK